MVRLAPPPTAPEEDFWIRDLQRLERAFMALPRSHRLEWLAAIEREAGPWRLATVDGGETQTPKT